VDRRELERVQADTGFRQRSLEYAYHAARIAKGLSEEPRLAGRYALKGGTALGLCYLGMARLSMDVDLNYVGSVSKETMSRERDADRPVMREGIAAIGPYRVSSAGARHPLDRYSAQFTGVTGDVGRIKVEVGYLDRLPLLGLVRRRVDTIFEELGEFEVSTYRLEELAGMKLTTLLGRRSARDLYDAAAMTEVTMEAEAVRAAFVVFSCTARGVGKDPLEALRRRVAGWPIGEQEAEFGQLLAESRRWSVEAARRRVLDWVEGLDLTEAERKFLSEFHDRGVISREPLHPSITAGLDKHPGLLWALEQRGEERSG